MNRFFIICKYLLYVIYYYRIKKTEQYINVLVQATKDLGGVYIKLAQFLSLRIDIFSPQTKMKFLSFYDQVEPEPLNVIDYLTHSLGSEKLSQFASIETQPFAAGTFGQVYRAKLTNSQPVIIKIKRSVAVKNLTFDLFTIYLLSLFIRLIYPQKLINIKSLVREFDHMTRGELNYQQEVANAIFLYQQYRHHPILCIPQTYQELSDNNIIVQDYIDGISVTDLLKMKLSGQDYYSYLINTMHTDMHFIIHRISYDIIWQALKLDRFYSDPHPGNIKILPNNRYAFIDFGILGDAPPNKRSYFHLLKLLTASADNLDLKSISRTMLDFGANDLISSLKIYDSHLNTSQSKINQHLVKHYQSVIADHCEEFKQIEIEETENYSKIWMTLFNSGSNLGVRLPDKMLATLRSAALIKSFTLLLEPDLHTMKQVYTDITTDIDHHQLLDYEYINRQPISLETATEKIFEWVNDLAETDLSLFNRLSTVIS